MTSSALLGKNNTERQNRILQAAEELICEHGLENTSLEAVAGKAGCSKSSIYLHFKNKEAILVAMYENTVEQLKKTLAHNMSQSRPVREILTDYAISNMRLTHSDRHIAIMRAIFVEIQHSPDIGKHYLEIGPMRAIRDLAGFFEERTFKGELNVTDTRHAAEMFLGSFHWPMQMAQLLGARSEPDQEEIGDEANQAVDLFLNTYGVHH